MAYKGKSVVYIKDIFDGIGSIFGPSKKKQEILSKTTGASYPSGDDTGNWRKYKKIRTNIGDLYAGDYVKAVKKSKNPPTYEKPYVKWDSDNYNVTSKTNTTPGKMILDIDSSSKKEKPYKSKYKYRGGGVKQKPMYLRKGKFIG